MAETVNQEAPAAASAAQTTPAQPAGKTFTQAELESIVADRLARERAKYPDYEDLKAKAHVIAVDALSLAEQAGSPKAVNVVLTGVLSKAMDLPEEVWQQSLETTVPPKFLELNKKAFELGRKS